MRKDVILGMSIGGVLLAIVIVYLTISPGHKNRGPGADLGKDGLVSSEGGSQDGSDSQPQTTDISKPSVADTGHQPAGPALGAQASGKVGPAAPAVPAKSGNVDQWTSKLEGRLDRSMLSSAVVTRTPDAPTGVANALGAGDRTPRPANVVVVPDPSRVVGPTAPPAAAPESPGTMHTHVVQKGETLSSIASMAYGSPNLYPHILRANPNLNPNRMRPGITINLPDINDVHPPRSAAPATATPDSPAAEHGVMLAAHNLDTTHEYVVQPGDSLHRIAIKLYGKIGMVDKIYDLNKDAIGPDKARLKLHMILKLPQPPLVVAQQ